MSNGGFSTENINVGDAVRVLCHNGANSVREYVGTVIKKTRAGKVDVKYSIDIVGRFDNDGVEHGSLSSFYLPYIEIDKMDT